MKMQSMMTALFLLLSPACIGDGLDAHSGSSPDTAPPVARPTGDGDIDVPCLVDPDGTCAKGTSIGVAAGSCTSTEITNARLGGVNFWTCQGNARYLCDDHGHKIKETCPNGCVSHPAGVDDECAFGSTVTCTATEFANQDLAGASLWTCNGGGRYVCDGEHFRVRQSCPNGCIGAGVGNDDQCN